MNGEVWVHDLPGLQSRQIEGAKMHSGSHIIVWDCFSAAGVETLGGLRRNYAYHRFGAGGVAGIAATDEKKQKWLVALSA